MWRGRGHAQKCRQAGRQAGFCASLNSWGELRSLDLSSTCQLLGRRETKQADGAQTACCHGEETARKVVVGWRHGSKPVRNAQPTQHMNVFQAHLPSIFLTATSSTDRSSSPAGSCACSGCKTRQGQGQSAYAHESASPKTAHVEGLACWHNAWRRNKLNVFACNVVPAGWSARRASAPLNSREPGDWPRELCSPAAGRARPQARTARSAPPRATRRRWWRPAAAAARRTGAAARQRATRRLQGGARGSCQGLAPGTSACLSAPRPRTTTCHRLLANASSHNPQELPPTRHGQRRAAGGPVDRLHQVQVPHKHHVAALGEPGRTEREGWAAGRGA